MPPRDYARLHFDWYRDPVLDAIADDEPAVMAIWPVLIGMTKEASHATTNPLGVIELGVGAIARAARVDTKVAGRALVLLEEGEMIDVEEGAKRGTRRIALTNFSKWQTPRKGKAEQEQARRDASRGNVEPRGDDVGAALPSVTRDERKVKVKPTLSAGADDVRRVFDYWVKVEAETGGFGSPAKGGRTPKMTTDRGAKIRSRLNEGFTVADLQRAIAFYAKDPHHAGDNDRGRRFTDLTTTLKSGSKVEQGIEGYEERRRGPSATTPAAGQNALAAMGYDL